MKWIALGVGLLVLAVILAPFRISSEQSQIEEEELWKKQSK